MLLSTHFLYTVVDVSAQDRGGECNVTVVRPNTLTYAGGALLSGTIDVRFNCVCTRSDGSLRNTRWYDTDGIRLQISVTIVPYHIIQSDRTATLVIPIFNMSYAGTYTCGGNFLSISDNFPPIASITLNICKLICS